MATVRTIEEEIERLSPAEFAELRDWLLEKDWEQWDRQIEEDAAAGKLDELFERARAAHDAGESREF
jgi:hypothetical protein